MSKTKIFIGSSSRSKRVADHLAVLLEQGEVHCRVWADGVFAMSRPILSDLVKATEEHHFAVLIYGQDDLVESAAGDQWAPRDNVVFESGLFTGALGIDRCFLVVAEGSKIPTDQAGLSVAFYDPERFEEDAAHALRSAATKIEESLRQHQPNATAGISRNLVDAFYLQTGLTEAFPRREDAKRRVFADIAKAKISVDMFARVYVSEVMRDQGALVEALKQAALSASGGELRISQTNTDARNEEMLHHAWQIEKTTEPPRFPTIDTFRSHLEERTLFLTATRNQLERSLESTPPMQRRRVRFFQRHLTSPITYSLIVIDDEIIWVSFYWRTGVDLPYGTFAPTMRLTCNGEDSSWAHRLVEQAQDVYRRSSCLGCDLGAV